MTGANEKRKAEARARIEYAIEHGSTRAEVAEIYGRSQSALIKAITNNGLRDKWLAKFGDEIREANARPLREWAKRTHAERKERRMERHAALLEDAEFLADTGEVMEQAAKRLGISGSDTLDRRLARLGRLDLVERFEANAYRMGVLPQGRFPHGQAA